MKEKIKTNLEKCFNQNYKLIKDVSFQDIPEKLIENNPAAYDMDGGSIRSLYEDEEIAILNKSKQHKRLAKLFESVKDELKTDIQSLKRIKKDIIDSIEIIKDKVKTENKGFKNQIIFFGA